MSTPLTMIIIVLAILAIEVAVNILIGRSSKYLYLRNRSDPDAHFANFCDLRS